MNPAIERFFRFVGGQVLGSVVTVATPLVIGYDYGPEWTFLGVFLGGALQAFDKFARDAGWYGGSLERKVISA